MEILKEADGHKVWYTTTWTRAHPVPDEVNPSDVVVRYDGDGYWTLFMCYESHGEKELIIPFA